MSWIFISHRHLAYLWFSHNVGRSPFLYVKHLIQVRVFIKSFDDGGWMWVSLKLSLHDQFWLESSLAAIVEYTLQLYHACFVTVIQASVKMKWWKNGYTELLIIIVFAASFRIQAKWYLSHIITLTKTERMKWWGKNGTEEYILRMSYLFSPLKFNVSSGLIFVFNFPKKF